MTNIEHENSLVYLVDFFFFFFSSRRRHTRLVGDWSSDVCSSDLSSSVVPFSSRLQSFPASGSFPMSQFLTSGIDVRNINLATSGGQSIGASASACPSNEYSGLISFRIHWLDLLAVQGTLKSLLQHHSSKASILQCLALFMVHLSHPYMTTGKTIALTRQTFV